MMLAQADVGQLPAGFLKEIIVLTIAGIILLCLVIGAIIGIAMWMIEKRREARELAAANLPAQPVSLDQPVLTQKIYPAATIRELNDVDDRHEKRLDGHDVQITALWNTMREEDKQIRKEIADQYQTISRQLGRIEGKLEGDSGIH
jgi:hypothetical protein